jgi:uncharacterized membrane protein
MSQAPAKDKEEQKKERDNIFLEILYNILIQLPIMAVAWIISQFTED